MITYRCVCASYECQGHWQTASSSPPAELLVQWGDRDQGLCRISGAQLAVCLERWWGGRQRIFWQGKRESGPRRGGELNPER